MTDIGKFGNFPVYGYEIIHAQVMDAGMAGYPGKGFQLGQRHVQIVGHPLCGLIHLKL